MARGGQQQRGLVGEGAQILDIGGESTRPGARQPTLDEELARVAAGGRVPFRPL